MARGAACEVAVRVNNQRMRQAMAYPRRAKGVTLIELLVTLAIAAILGAIAYPSFMGSIYKSRRADASAGLIRVQQAAERWRSSHTAYPNNLAEMGESVASSPEGRYTLTFAPTGNGTTYEATATATGAQANDTKCKFLRVAMTGSGNLVYTSSVDGVAYVSNSTCWVR